MAAIARELITHLHRRATLVQDPEPVAGDGLLHPLVLAALALLVVNDHLLKPMLPGIATGKLSDVAGLLLAPVVAVAAIELVAASAGRRSSPSQRWLVAICALIAAGFAAVKVTAVGAVALGAALGLGQWLGGMLASPLLGTPPPPAVAGVVVDPTDLVALGSVAGALAILRRRRRLLAAAGWR
jgi:hypothetical protein